MAGETAITPKTSIATVKPRLFTSKKFMQGFTATLSTLIVGLGALIIMVPIIWMVTSSLKVRENILVIPPEWIPRKSVTFVLDKPLPASITYVTAAGEQIALTAIRTANNFALYEDASGAISIEVDGAKRYYYYDVNLSGETKRLVALKLDPTKSSFMDANTYATIYEAPVDSAVKSRVTKIHWENYREAYLYSKTPFSIFMGNTLMYAFLAVFGEVLSCSLVAYGFARLRAPGKDGLFLLVLATLMLPAAVTMIPSFVLFTKYIPDFLNGIFGTKIVLADSWIPLILPKFMGSAYLIFLVRQFYMGIPKDYDDAARIDGCSYFQTWWRIIIPMSRPVLVAMAVLSFMYHWNDYMGPLIYLNSTHKFPFSIGLANFQQQYAVTPYHLILAASIIAVLPLVAIFFALNRYFIQGIVVSGVKG